MFLKAFFFPERKTLGKKKGIYKKKTFTKKENACTKRIAKK